MDETEQMAARKSTTGNLKLMKGLITKPNDFKVEYEKQKTEMINEKHFDAKA